jgi:hypothetical protein
LAGNARPDILTAALYVNSIVPKWISLVLTGRCKLIAIYRKTGKTSWTLPAWDCCFGAAVAVPVAYR